MAADDVIATLVHSADCIDGGHTAGKNARSDSALERRQVLFQAIARRIGNSGVFVAFVLAEFLLNVSGGGVNGNGYRTCGGIGLLSIVNGAGSEAGCFESLAVGRWSLAVRHSPLLVHRWPKFPFHEVSIGLKSIEDEPILWLAG